MQERDQKFNPATWSKAGIRQVAEILKNAKNWKKEKNVTEAEKTAHAIEVMKRLADALVETVRESGGAPSGTIYMAFQSKFSWWSLEVHERMIESLVRAGRLTNKAHWLEAK